MWVRGDIIIVGDNVTQVAFKSCAPFTKCITKIDRKTIDDPEELGLVMLMYNLLEYRSNYSEKKVVCGFILKMKQRILMLLLRTLMILNLLRIRLKY